MTIGQLAELRDWVLEFLRLTALSAEEQREPAVAQRLEYCIEQLWVLMRQDLLDLASQWLRSELGRNQINFEGFDDAKVKLALIALEGIYLRLPGTEIDPEKNLKGLLCTIAKRTLIDENNKLQPLAALYAKHFAKGRSVKDTEDLHMWNPLEIERGGNKSEDVADPSSFNWENDLIVAFNRTDQRKAMLLAIDTLPQRDQNIIRLRYGLPLSMNGSAPENHEASLMPFKDIANILQESEVSVRKRCSRALARLRAYVYDDLDL